MEEGLSSIRGKEFYNDLIGADAGIYGAEPEDIAYYPLWEWFLDKFGYGNILDVGCGTGRFARKAIEKYCSVVGIDFSSVAIEKAREYEPKGKYVCLDVEDPNADIFKLFSYDVVFLSEILEHIADDLKLLSQIPKRKHVFLTVPNFNGDGHVRWFNTLAAVEERYGETLEIKASNMYRNWYALYGGKR